MMMKMFNNIANRSTNTPMMTWKSDEKHNEKQAKQKKKIFTKILNLNNSVPIFDLRCLKNTKDLLLKKYISF
jgi:hypothetical protein